MSINASDRKSSKVRRFSRRFNMWVDWLWVGELCNTGGRIVNGYKQVAADRRHPIQVVHSTSLRLIVSSLEKVSQSSVSSTYVFIYRQNVRMLLLAEPSWTTLLWSEDGFPSSFTHHAFTLDDTRCFTFKNCLVHWLNVRYPRWDFSCSECCHFAPHQGAG